VSFTEDRKLSDAVGSEGGEGREGAKQRSKRSATSALPLFKREAAPLMSLKTESVM
jgi:hypothetical protein